MNNLKIPNVPHLVHIETTYSCNSKCIFCYNPRRGESFNKEKIDLIVKSIYESWVPHVYLIGGEPSVLGVDQLNTYIDFLAKRSSVTIVTNGLIRLEGLSKNLACIGMPIHGNERIHEKHTGMVGGYNKSIETAKYYVNRGFDVRCIPVLTAWNFDQMYDIIGVAKQLGMESVFVDRFEDGGIGNKNSSELKPSIDQFKTALGQMILARDDFAIPVGFGTAIPYCLDERLITENMFANCGAGITFCAVNPDGSVRLCNQSEIIYGNVLKEPIEQIWQKKQLDDFRNLLWVKEPCASCTLLTDCLCGCKVDSSCSASYCIDYAVRGMNSKFLDVVPKKVPEPEMLSEYPSQYRLFVLDRYTKLNEFHSEKYLVTRYQTIKIDDTAIEIIRAIINGETDEKSLIARFEDTINEKEIRSFLTKLSVVDAIRFIDK